MKISSETIYMLKLISQNHSGCAGSITCYVWRRIGLQNGLVSERHAPVTSIKLKTLTQGPSDRHPTRRSRGEEAKPRGLPTRAGKKFSSSTSSHQGGDSRQKPVAIYRVRDQDQFIVIKLIISNCNVLKTFFTKSKSLKLSCHCNFGFPGQKFINNLQCAWYFFAKITVTNPSSSSALTLSVVLVCSNIVLALQYLLTEHLQ